jgi:hypothetical protein
MAILLAAPNCPHSAPMFSSRIEFLQFSNAAARRKILISKLAS